MEFLCFRLPVAVTLVLLAAACAGPVEPDFTDADDIPSRPGIIETLGGEELKVEL